LIAIGFVAAALDFGFDFGLDFDFAANFFELMGIALITARRAQTPA
jgi:hypothetical protein